MSHRNWKECAWKDLNEEKDNGLIKVHVNFCGKKKNNCFPFTRYFMLITSPRKQKRSSYKYLNFGQKACSKYLGIYIEQHLNWKDQIPMLKQGIQIFGILCK